MNRLIAQLERHVELGVAEKSALRAAGTTPRRFGAHRDVMKPSEPAMGMHVVDAGLACRYVDLPNGRRQILAFLMPGDLCGLRACVLEGAEHSVGSLGPLETTFIPREAVADITTRFPQILRSFWALTMLEDITAREWLLNLGHRSAYERMAHLLCELFTRLTAAGLASENTCELPIRQTDLADALALTPVHVNRVLMQLRRQGLITLEGRRLTVHDQDALRAAGGFKESCVNRRLQRPVPAPHYSPERASGDGATTAKVMSQHGTMIS